MTDLMAGEIVAALLLLVGVITLIALQGKDNPGPDVGVDIVDCGMVADVDEDIQHPRVEVIDDALRQVGADNRGAQDWLLDRRLAEMQRRAAS
jgi:hypothetical protein